MSVAELIAFLQTCPPDTSVMVESGELGIQYLESKNCVQTYARLDEWAGMGQLGPHEQQDTWEGWRGLDEDPPPVVIPIVLLGRS